MKDLFLTVFFWPLFHPLTVGALVLTALATATWCQSDSWHDFVSGFFK